LTVVRHHSRECGDQHRPDLGPAGLLRHGDSHHPQGATAYKLSNGVAVTYQVAQEVVKDDKGCRNRSWWTASRASTRTANRGIRSDLSEEQTKLGSDSLVLN